MPLILKDTLLRWRKHRTFPDHANVFICDETGGFCLEQYGKPYKERMHFMTSLCEKAGVKPFGYHGIRHLTASTLFRLGRPVSEIQAILRHKSPNTTVKYLRSLGLEETRDAMDALAEFFRSSEHRRTTITSGTDKRENSVNSGWPVPDAVTEQNNERGLPGKVILFSAARTAGNRLDHIENRIIPREGIFKG